MFQKIVQDEKVTVSISDSCSGGDGEYYPTGEAFVTLVFMVTYKYTKRKIELRTTGFVCWSTREVKSIC